MSLIKEIYDYRKNVCTKLDMDILKSKLESNGYSVTTDKRSIGIDVVGSKEDTISKIHSCISSCVGIDTPSAAPVELYYRVLPISSNHAVIRL